MPDDFDVLREPVAPTVVNGYTHDTIYVGCSSCEDGEFSIGHVAVGSNIGPWYCDECGAGNKWKRLSDEEFEVVPCAERCDKSLVTLESVGPVRLIVRGMLFSGANWQGTDFNQTEHDEYYYNEHTCPTNYMSGVVRVIDPSDGDTDPHGIFAYVKTEPWRDLEDE